MTRDARSADFLRGHGRAFAGAGVVLLAAVGLLAYSVELQRIYQDFLSWQDRNSALFIASFVGLFVLAALTSAFPASILGVAAGAVFGVVEGFALSAGALLLAALLAFTLARYFFRDVSRSIASKFLDIDHIEDRLRRYGWRYALLIRSAPLAPFGITSYGLGITPIPLSQYIVTTMGAFPFLLACVYLGSISRVVGAGAGGVDQHVLFKIAALLTIAVVGLALAIKVLPRLVRRLLNGAG